MNSPTSNRLAKLQLKRRTPEAASGMELPDPLINHDGTAITNTDQWRRQRRELFRIFESQVYGKAPQASPALNLEEISRCSNALNGTATRTEWEVSCPTAPAPKWYLLAFTPNVAPKPAPAFLGLNFNGNHSIHADPGIRLSTAWMRPIPEHDTHQPNRATEHSRGTSASRWPVADIIDRGYAVVTLYYGDIDPDFDDGFQNGIHGAIPSFGRPTPATDEWGSIAAWSWGLSRALDMITITIPEIDASRVAVIGHSRLGKAALWAGVCDERFAMVVTNNSGCGGAALNRRRVGETFAAINHQFPHWFCGNFKQYNDKEDTLTVDQHMLIALIAPRPVYIASAEEDHWADPLGEFLAAKHASPVYQLLGKTGLDAVPQPEVHHPVGDSIGYHIRSGKHDITPYDWSCFLDFADRHI